MKTECSFLIYTEKRRSYTDKIHYNGLYLSFPIEQSSGQLSMVDCLGSLESDKWNSLDGLVLTSLKW